MDHLTKAKAQLVMDQPFFASLLLGMPITEDASVKTMATDGESIRYNPEFLNSMTLPETVFVLAHEVMHCVFQHMHRKGARNHNKWNIAGDHVINDTLVREKIGVMPKMGLCDSALVAQGKGTTEGVYDLLPESDNSKEAGDGASGGSMDDCQDAGQDEADRAAKEAEMKVKIVQATNAAKMCGKLSAGIARIVKDFTKPHVDWKSVLRRFITEKAKTDLSYARPKRRFLAEDIYLPSLTGEKIGSVVVAVDCSGSVSPDLLNSFASEIKAIIQDIVPEMTHVIYFDSEVLRTDSYGQDDSFEVHAVGGGGTAFSPIFESIEKQGITPVACVVLTDLECSDFGECPVYPVLWASTSRDNAPFGEIVKLRV